MRATTPRDETCLVPLTPAVPPGLALSAQPCPGRVFRQGWRSCAWAHRAGVQREQQLSPPCTAGDMGLHMILPPGQPRTQCHSQGKVAWEGPGSVTAMSSHPLATRSPWELCLGVPETPKSKFKVCAHERFFMKHPHDVPMLRLCLFESYLEDTSNPIS